MPETPSTADSLDALAVETSQLRSDLADTRAELREQTDLARKANQQRDIALRETTMNTRIAIGLVFVLLACTIAAAFQVSLANSRAIEANNLRWCPLLISIGPRPGAPAPAGNAEQQKYARDTRALIADLALQYGCKRPADPSGGQDP